LEYDAKNDEIAFFDVIDTHYYTEKNEFIYTNPLNTDQTLTFNTDEDLLKYVKLSCEEEVLRIAALQLSDDDIRRDLNL